MNAYTKHNNLKKKENKKNVSPHNFTEFITVSQLLLSHAYKKYQTYANFFYFRYNSIQNYEEINLIEFYFYKDFEIERVEFIKLFLHRLI